MPHNDRMWKTNLGFFHKNKKIPFKPPHNFVSYAEKSKCTEIYHTHQLGIIDENRNRNHYYFDKEVDKLENGVRMYLTASSLKQSKLDMEIKTRKTEAWKLLNLEQKVKEQRIIKDLEKKLAEKRYNQYQNEDDIEQTTEIKLFIIRWQII